MSSFVAWGTLVALLAALVFVSLWYPGWLNDSGNSFLKNFVGFELLSFLGVVVTITLASASNLHLELNKLEARTQKHFPKTRNSIRLSSYSLIGLLIIGFILAVTKPIVAGNDTCEALWNSSAIVIIVFNVFVLTDITRTTLAIPSS